MTHWMTLDDWDSDGVPKSVRCGCDRGEDHPQDLVFDLELDSSRFEAELIWLRSVWPRVTPEGL